MLQEKSAKTNFLLNQQNFHQVHRQKEQVCSSLVFSHPDYTVGCGIAPHQLTLADFFKEEEIDIFLLDEAPSCRHNL